MYVRVCEGVGMCVHVHVYAHIIPGIMIQQWHG